MSRTEHLESVTKTFQVPVPQYFCDGKDCGTEIFENTEPYVNTLDIGLNTDQCAGSFTRERHYCQGCLENIWDQINKAIGGDPEIEDEDARD